MPRRRKLALIAVGTIAFLTVSTLLAKVWSAGGAESSAVTALVQAEARGDQHAMVDALLGCRISPSCQARVATDIASLRHRGPVSILELNASTGFSLTGSLGVARVAWRVASSLPIVQCVRVRRTGDAIAGLHIELLEISAKIKSDTNCPRRF